MTIKNRVSKFLAQRLSFSLLVTFILFSLSLDALAVMFELNSTGGTSATNGLHLYIDSNTQMQVRRLNNTGQMYHPNSVPPNNNLDNGIYLRANGAIYGPDHFAFNANAYSTESLTAPTPANPVTDGTQQTTTASFGINAGPQVTVRWKYLVPYDFATAEVTLVIPAGYTVSAANPVRYYHALDTFLGGSDFGCGVRYVDADGKAVVGTYPPMAGNTCPTSNALPVGATFVQSFRERTGTFTNYCVSNYDHFWDNNFFSFFRDGCSIANPNNLANRITTTRVDTGVAIQYSFTAPGTYTFSYDYVVGTTQVPVYDHFEIRHPGTATLCPLDIQVLACTVSTMPCPAGSSINTGVLTGSIRTTPGSPSFTQNPTSFSLGNSGNAATVTMQASSGGTVTLGSQSLSATPLNGTRCWNTSTGTESCTLQVNNTPCATRFECLETGVGYNNTQANPSLRNPLYTQVTGQNFSFDVVAVTSTGAISTAYTGTNVTVALFDNATPAATCAAYASPLATQTISFVTGNNGRRATGNFNINNAYRRLICRVTDSVNNIQGCSTDQFAIRPPAFTSVTSTNANADNTGANASASPNIRAGANFSLTVTTGYSGYNGTPKVNTVANHPSSNPLDAHGGAVQDGVAAGNFNVAVSGVATGNAFTYSEVGYFRFNANGIYDDDFTSVDSGVNDCAAGFTASGGKNACNFGNTAQTNYFGRFTPDHLGTVTTQACGAFTYAKQPFTTVVTAYNSANTLVRNYHGAGTPRFSKAVALSDANAVAGAMSGNSISDTAFNQGVATATPVFTFSNDKTVPSTIRLRALDADSVTSSSVEGTIALRSGRLNFTNAHGSELLPLSFVVEAQYWSAVGAYQRNTLDNCSAVNRQGFVMNGYTKSLSACETQLSGGGTMVNGKIALALSGPGAGNNGSVTISANLDNGTGAGIQTCTSGAATSATGLNLPQFGTADVTRRATFGVYKSPLIYMRESF